MVRLKAICFVFLSVCAGCCVAFCSVGRGAQTPLQYRILEFLSQGFLGQKWCNVDLNIMYVPNYVRPIRGSLAPDLGRLTYYTGVCVLGEVGGWEMGDMWKYHFH